MSQYDAPSPTSPTGGSIQSLRALEATPQGKRDRWATEIQAAEKELRGFHNSARKVTRRYIDERDGFESDKKWFNIFKTNTEILEANLYANIPSVDVSRRFLDAEDDVARVAGLVLQRCIEQDMNEPGCDFDNVMRQVVQDRLVPGLGVAWVRLRTETEEQKSVPDYPTDTYDETETQKPEEPKQSEPLLKITDQQVCMDWVYWEDFLWSPCRVWPERRWVGRRVPMTYDALVKRFGEAKAHNIPLDYTTRSTNTTDTPTPPTVLKQACIYEIWDRSSRTVIWYSRGYPELLDEQSDPLRLHDGRFEPCPTPLFANVTTSSCLPKPDYAMMQDQYAELDETNNRIALLIKAVKAVGVYDKSAEGVQRMLQEGTDNTLIPVDNWAMFAEKGGIKGQVDWLPLEAVIQALQALQQHREAVKAQVYELSGISDIVRGFTAASETLGAQELKSKYASIRIQKLQDTVVRFAEELLQIKADILCTHFEPEILARMSNAANIPDAKIAPPAPPMPPQMPPGPPGMPPGPPGMMAPPGPSGPPQMPPGMPPGRAPGVPIATPPSGLPPGLGQLRGGPPGMPGGMAPPMPPPGLPPVPPDLSGPMLIQTAIEFLKSPWELVSWRVSIEADSMAMVDYTRQKQERTEFLNATATFLQSAATVGQNTPQFMPMLLQLLKFGVAGFRISKEVEGIFDKYIKEFEQEIEKRKNAPPPPDPNMMKIQAEMQFKQAEAQTRQAESQADMQAKQMDAQLKQQSAQAQLAMDQQKHQQEMAQMAQEFQLKMSQMQEEFALRMQQLDVEGGIKAQNAQIQGDIKVEQARAKGNGGGE